MDWFRCYHGMPEDPKLHLVAAQAGVKPGHVISVWAVLLDHASRARPRGSVATVDSEALAVSLGWEPAQVQAIIDTLTKRRHIVDGELRAWPSRNPGKFDKTAAERKRRQRSKEKAEGDEAPANTPESLKSHAESHGVTGVTGVSRNVTPTEEIERSDISDSLSCFSTSSLKQPTTRTVREQAGAIIDAGLFWAWITAQGIPAHIGIRTMNRGRLAEWLERGLTEANLDEAMVRATQKRRQQRSQHPVNLGFLGCFVDDVLAGAPAQTETNPGGGYERGDQLGRDFASAR